MPYLDGESCQVNLECAGGFCCSNKCRSSACPVEALAPAPSAAEAGAPSGGGGEIPTMLITDAVIRLIKGSLDEEVTNTESFSPYVEYPQYTRPKVFKRYSVPAILLSGDHKKIGEWRKTTSLKHTEELRPDLL